MLAPADEPNGVYKCMESEHIKSITEYLSKIKNSSTLILYMFKTSKSIYCLQKRKIVLPKGKI
jgi:hypothetical protein